MPEKTLNILIWYWGRKGGGARYTHELMASLCKINSIRLYVSLSKQSEYFEKSKDLKNVVGRFDIPTYHNIPTFIISCTKLPVIKLRLERFISKNKIDVVICTMDHLWNIFVLNAIKKYNTLYMLTVHDATRHPGENQFWRDWLLSKDIQKTDGSIVLTESVGLRLIEKYNYSKNRIFHSKHGHFGDYIKETPRKFPKSRPFKLLFFGRILPYKGLDILLDAYHYCRENNKNLELEVWGAGDITKYENIINKLDGLKIFNRWINEEEFPSIFEANDLLILPYKEASQSGVVCTAQAYGMPTVISPIPGLCEQIEHDVDGYVIDSLNYKDLADGIEYIISNPDKYEYYSTNSIEKAKNELSWDQIALKIINSARTLNKLGKRI